MQELKEFFSIENITHLIEHYSSLGMLVGFLWPFVDSFIALFPLALIVTINVNAFGFWQGFLLSYFGSALGTIGMFFLVRKLGSNIVLKYFNGKGKRTKLMNLVDHAGFGPFFLLICLPFTPSFLLNVFAAISRVRISSYLPASILGKFIMILTVSYIGKDIQSYFEHPIKTVFLLLLLGALWRIGKVVESRFDSKANSGVEQESKISP